MTTWNDVGKHVAALPEAEEAEHFRLPAFKVEGKTFIVLQKGETHAIFHTDKVVAKDAAKKDPAHCEEIWRNDGRIFVGVRVELAKVPVRQVRALAEAAWRHKAPKRLVAAGG